MTHRLLHAIKTVTPFAFWLILFIFALLWRLPNFDAFGLLNDEGAYLMWSRLLATGYPLYAQTFAVAPPLLLLTLAITFKTLGFSIVVARGVILIFFAVLLLIIGDFGRRLAGWGGAFVALLAAAMVPNLFLLSRQVMLEVPALTLALLAVWCGYRFWLNQPIFGRFNADHWLWLAGVMLALSLMIKFLHPLAGLPVLAFIGWRSQSWVIGGRRLVWLGLGAVLTLATVLIWFDVGAFVEQTVTFRAATRDTNITQLTTSNGAMLLALAGDLWGLVLLALSGALLTWQKKTTRAWMLWLGANLLLVLWYQPLFSHHLTILLPPLLLLLLEFVAWLTAQTGYRRWVGVAALLIAALNLPAWFAANQQVLAITTGGREAEAAALIEQVTRPGDFVMADSQLLALFADRQTPPPLGDFSMALIQTGRQTAPRLIQLSDTYQVQAVAPWALRMVWLPDYIAWAEQNFLVHKVWDNDHQLYFGRKHPPNSPIPNKADHRFEQGLSLRGYQLDTPAEAVTDTLPLTLYWQTAQSIGVNYTIFVQLLGPDGRLVSQHDSQPIFGYFPTSQWPLNQTIPDRMTLPLPADLPTGSYTLIAGLYNLQTGNRLPLQTGGDFVTLATLELGR